MDSSSRSPLLLAAALVLAASCSSDFDKSRAPAPETSLGQDVYSVLCDCLGASVFTEDVTGESYQGVCHPGLDGTYADAVDESKLPPASGTAALARAASIAEMAALVRRRAQLIEALDKTFDKVDLPVPFGKNGETIDSHAALSQFLKTLTPLYEQNPVEPPPSEPLVPGVTRAVGRLFAGFAGPGQDGVTDAVDAQKAGAARAALERIAGRQGYRPISVVLGALRPALAYPGLRSLTQTLAPRLGPGGPLRDVFQTVLGMTQNELSTSQPTAPLPPYRLVDAATLQPSRPRTKLEIAKATMLAEDPAFAAAGATSHYLVMRDLRGVAVPAGNVPGTPGSVPAPFIDADGDGLADVDGFGRFVAAGGGIAHVDPPFVIPGLVRIAAPDAFGRAVSASGQPLYQYHDTSRTLSAALLRDVVPLLDPDPADHHETIADVLAGAFKLYGDRVERPADWAPGGTYMGFDASRSPIVDLLYATAQILADKQSDASLALLEKLVVEHEDLVARVLGAALRIRDVSNQHPEAKLDPKDTFWDEMAEFVVKLTDDPGLFKDVLRALEDPDFQTYFGNAMADYHTYRDRFSYNPNALNGPALNLTVGGGSTADPQVLTDPSKPDTGDNMSEMYTILQMVHDMNGVAACNKAGAKVQVKLAGLNVSWPLLGSYKECELFVFPDMGVLYVQSMLGRASMNLRDGTLNGILKLVGGISNLDQLFEQASGISGMTLSPTPQALNRLVFFGATGSRFDPMPDADPFVTGKNATTEAFVSSLLDPMSTVICPKRAVADPKGQLGVLKLADCSGSKGDLVRLRDKGVMFAWEHYNFYKGIAPLARAFDDHGADPLFLDAMDLLYRHWPTAAHGPECIKYGSWRKGAPDYNPKYCAESGLSRYEPILREAFKGDLLPALGALVKAVDSMSIVDTRNGGTTVQGLDLLHHLTVALFDPKYAASVGLKTRQIGDDVSTSHASTTWADGTTPKPQVTPFDLLAMSMRAIDQALDGDPRQASFHSARSQIVDQFLGIDGDGAGSKFRNATIPKAAPILIQVLREQLDANCPDRETTGACPWANDADSVQDDVEARRGHLRGTDVLDGDGLPRRARPGSGRARRAREAARLPCRSSERQRRAAIDPDVAVRHDAAARRRAEHAADLQRHRHDRRAGRLQGRRASRAGRRGPHAGDDAGAHPGDGQRRHAQREPLRPLPRPRPHPEKPRDADGPRQSREHDADRGDPRHHRGGQPPGRDGEPGRAADRGRLRRGVPHHARLHDEQDAWHGAAVRDREASQRHLNMRRALVIGTVLAVASSVTAVAHAGGLYFSDRGVRPLGRGGAFVAGADDAGSVAYNPAGLAFTGHQFLLDAAWLQYSSKFQRKQIITQTDPNTGQTFDYTQTDRAVEGTTPVLPIPTIAYADNFGAKQLNFALSVWAPYAAITSYPEKVGGSPAPQRYSLISLDGSALAVGGLYASYRPAPVVAFGAGVEILGGYFSTSVVMNACPPDRFVCAPEDPDFDALSRLKVGPIVAPSGILGMILVPDKHVRIGTSFHLPFWIRSAAQVDVRMPQNPIFSTAYQQGDKANVAFNLPWTWRLGIEARPLDLTRIEAGLAVEGWSMHDRITLDPDNVQLSGLQGFPDHYKVNSITLERGFQNSWSMRLGAEQGFKISSYVLDVRAGAAYEKSAIPAPYLSATTIDLDKVTLSVGGSLHIGKWRFDGVYARVIGMPVNVDPAEARIAEVNPVRANLPATPHTINAGHYEANANVYGVGLAYQFDSPAEPPTRPAPGAGD